MPKFLSLMFHWCGISPSGTRTDKYFAMASLSLMGCVIFKLGPPIYTMVNDIESSWKLISFLMLIVSAIVVILRNWIKPKSYINIMKDLESIESELKHMNGENKTKMTWVLSAIFWFSQGTLFCQFGFYTSVAITVINIFTTAPLLQQMFIIERMHYQYLLINEQMTAMTDNVDAHTTRAQQDSMFRVHSSLQALLVDVDFHFSWYHLFRFTSKFLHCVLIMYAYLMSIENDNRKFDFQFLPIFIREAVSSIFLTLVCHACSAEANRTVLLAHRVLHPDTQPILWEEVGLFSSLAVDNKVHFTVGGIFTLDRALITHTALTALSYLIIAVQLREVKLL